LTCRLNPRYKLLLHRAVYIDIECFDDKIYYIYDIKNLKTQMKKYGFCPGNPWKQLTPHNIKRLHSSVIDSPDIKGLFLVRELQEIHNNNILETVEKLLSEVHTIKNTHLVVSHSQTTRNIQERRGNCGLAIMELYDLIKEQKTQSIQKELLEELGESLPVCIEAKCNFIREFVEMKRGGLKYKCNSLLPKVTNISNAVNFLREKWCAEAQKQNQKAPKEYFKDKLKDMFTRVQTLLQNKISSDGKIDYTDIEDFLLKYGESILNCENLNFNNIKLNTIQQKIAIFGMIRR